MNNHWESKKVLITGANGFTGSNLCHALLDSGANVRVLVRKKRLTNLEEVADRLDIVYGDVCDEDDVHKATADIDYLFHVATYSSVLGAKANPQKALDINIRGTYNVFHAAAENNVPKSVHVSTCHVYGNPPKEAYPLKEETIPRPNDFYSACRGAAEVLLHSFINQGQDIVITRAFNHYGPFQTGEHLLIPAILRKALTGQNPVLNDPNTTRDYCYVSDIINGYLLAAEKGQAGEVYHFSSEQETRGGDLCDLILKVGKEEFNMDPAVEPIWSGPRKSDMNRSSGDSSKARETLGWKPEVSLEEGIRKTLAWWQQSPLAKEVLAEKF